MKIECHETAVGYFFALEAEDVKDAAFLIRFGLNAKKQPNHGVYADRNDIIGGYIEIAARTHRRSFV